MHAWAISTHALLVSRSRERREHIIIKISAQTEKREFKAFIDGMEQVNFSVLGKKYSLICSNRRTMNTLDYFSLIRRIICKWKGIAQWTGWERETSMTNVRYVLNSQTKI